HRINVLAAYNLDRKENPEVGKLLKRTNYIKSVAHGVATFAIDKALEGIVLLLDEQSSSETADGKLSSLAFIKELKNLWSDAFCVVSIFLQSSEKRRLLDLSYGLIPGYSIVKQESPYCQAA